MAHAEPVFELSTNRSPKKDAALPGENRDARPAKAPAYILFSGKEMARRTLFLGYSGVVLFQAAFDARVGDQPNQGDGKIKHIGNPGIYESQGDG